MAKLQNSCRPFSLEKFLSIEVIGTRSIRSHAPDDPVTGGAEESHWRGGGESLEGRRRVTGGAEESHWRGAGRRRVTGGAEDSHWRGGGESLEGRRTVTGGAEDSYWRGGVKNKASAYLHQTHTKYHVAINNAVID